MVVSTAKVCFRKGEKKVFRKFRNSGVTPIIQYVDFEGKTLRYISDRVINNKIPTILFIHGAPGSSSNYFKFLKDKQLGKITNLISVDRLGYGYSDHGNSETSIEKQADSIFAIAEKHQLENIVVLGWSFGVPIAAKMAYKYPQIKHSVLIAGAIDPKHERYFLAAKLIDWKLTKWLVFKPFLVANDEKLAHVAELTKMENDWQQIQTPITYYHGTRDAIVPYENMDFIKNKVSEKLLKPITLKGANHFILKRNYNLVKDELLAVLKGLK